MLSTDKIIEIYCMADDFCKLLDGIDSTGKVIKEKRRRIEKKQFARSVVDFKLKDQ